MLGKLGRLFATVVVVIGLIVLLGRDWLAERAFQRALDFILYIKEIKNRLTPAVMFQLAGHLGDIFRRKFQ